MYVLQKKTYCQCLNFSYTDVSNSLYKKNKGFLNSPHLVLTDLVLIRLRYYRNEDGS